MSRVHWYAAALLCLISVSAWAQTPALVVDVQQRSTFNGPEVTGGDAGDDLYYRIFIQNTTGDTAYDVTVTDVLPLDYIDLVTCCITTGPSTGAAVLANPSPGPFQFYWPEVAGNTTVSVSLRYSVKNAVAPGESWTNSASVTWAATPGGSTVGFEDSDTTGPYTVPDLSVVKQIEHPSQTPIATTFFGGAYSDSTSDPNTGTGAHNASNVDLAIGEEFSYIITFTFPEGTSYEVTAIDLASPVNQAGGPENRVIELLTAQVIWAGGNLTGNLIEPVGTPYNVVDISADGDGDRFQAFNTGVRDVLNTPDGVENDDDRFVIRVTARLDDEDAGQYNGGASDDDPAIPGNNDGNIAENKLQLQWRDQFGNQTTQNPAPGSAANNDVVEPAVTVAKTTNTGSPVGIGDPVQFTLTVSNTGTAPAYDWVVNDLFPTEAGNPVLAFDSIDIGASSCDDLSGYSLIQFSSTEYRLGADALLSGASCTLVMNTIVQSSAVNNVYTNSSAALAYASRPDPMAIDIRNYVGTGSATSTFAVDAIAPVISEATPVTSPTNDATPNVTLNSTEAGTLQIGGSCGSPAEGAVPSGPFTITLTQPDNASPLADGSYADCTAIVTDAAGNPSNLLTLSAFVIDATAPVVAETTRQVPADEFTNAHALTFRPTFDGDVENLDATDFVASGTTATVSGIAPVTGTSVFDVTVSGGDLAGLDGVVGLDLAAAQDIADAAGNPLAGTEPAVDETYTVDNTPPVLQSFTRSVPIEEFTNADTLTFQATFDGDVENVDAADFAVTGTTATVSDVTQVTGTSVFDVTVSGGDLAGLDGVVGLDLAAAQDIADAAGNPLAGTEPPIDETYTLDNTEAVVTVDVLVTTDNTPPLTGTIDDAQATLELLVDGQTVVPTNNGDGTWSRADDTLAAIANGTYDVQVTATDGAGNVSTDATIDELTITPDTDGDGVDNVIEDAGPNVGDANNDGVPDADQPSVASLPTATGRGYMWLEATGCPQFRGVAAVDSATLPADPLGDPYLFGLVEFQLPCETATVAISFEQGVPSLFSNSSYRKYGPVTPGDVATTSWYDFSSDASLNGNTWTLQLADNALGDDTGDDGVIVGVGGPAIGRPLAIPTLQPWALVLLALAMLVLVRRKWFASQ